MQGMLIRWHIMWGDAGVLGHPYFRFSIWLIPREECFEVTIKNLYAQTMRNI